MTDNISGTNQQSSMTVSNAILSIASSCSGVNRRQKSWDLLDQTAIAQARQHKQPQHHQVSTRYINCRFGMIYRMTVFNNK